MFPSLRQHTRSTIGPGDLCSRLSLRAPRPHRAEVTQQGNRELEWAGNPKDAHDDRQGVAVCPGATYSVSIATDGAVRVFLVFGEGGELDTHLDVPAGRTATLHATAPTGAHSMTVVKASLTSRRPTVRLTVAPTSPC